MQHFSSLAGTTNCAKIVQNRPLSPPLAELRQNSAKRGLALAYHLTQHTTDGIGDRSGQKNRPLYIEQAAGQGLEVLTYKADEVRIS